MRLLNTKTLQLEEYFGQDVPPYAILSHRWGAEEVTFSEMTSHRSRLLKPSAGFKKIRGFCRQAFQGGFKYAWADTCCINKESSAELSEAINSMFQWYAEAAVCYAYLTDVSGSLPKGKELEVLGESPWFRRGWTLQELIAPSSVVFYSALWIELGTREDLKTIIASITGIHPWALGASIQSITRNFSIAQRMSWAANRETTREEDRAYCLLGIFNVNMPLLYGEKQKAFIRLQEHIINESNDQSIFCWSDFTATTSRGKMKSSRFYVNTPTDLLASSPLLFKNCAKIAQSPELTTREEFRMTKMGLSITGPICSLRAKDKFAGIGDHLIYLRCYDQDAPNHHIAIMLRELGDNDFSRKNRVLCRIPGALWEGTESRTVYIRKQSAIPSYHRKVLQAGRSLSFQINSSVLGKQMEVVECWPNGQWISESNRLVAPEWQNISVSVNNWSWHAALLLRVVPPEHTEPREKEDHSLDCMLALGYDGIHDRCWSLLKSGADNVEELWEQCVDTTQQYTTYELPSEEFKWTIKVDLVDFPEEQPVQVAGDALESAPFRSSYIVPVKIEILKHEPIATEDTVDESLYDLDLRRRLEQLAGKQSFAMLVNHSFFLNLRSRDIQGHASQQAEEPEYAEESD